MDRKTITPDRVLQSALVDTNGGVRQETANRPGEPRWPALLALLAIGCLYYALPGSLTIGPNWLVLILAAF